MKNRLLLYILAFALIIYIFALNPKVVGEIYDDGVYIWLAKCLINGKGFPSPRYPIGFPAILSPILKLFPQFPQNIIPLKSVSIIMTLLFLVSVYFFLTNCDYTTKNTALLITLLTAINPGILSLSVQVMSEMSYSLFVILALMFTELETTYYSTKNRFNILLFLVPLFGVFSFLTRRIGISLILSVVIYYFIKVKLKRSIPIYFLLIIFMSPWIWYTQTHKTIGYIPEFWYKNLEHLSLGTIGIFDLIIRVGNNLWSVITRGIGGIIFPFSISWTFLNMTTIMKMPFLYPLLQLIFSLVAIVGFLYSFKNLRLKTQSSKPILGGFRLLHFYMIFYTGIVLLWPFPPDRFLIPLTPFIFYYFIYGVQQLCYCSQNSVDMQNRRFYTPKLYFYVLIGLIIISCLKRDIGYIYNVHRYGHEGGKEAGLLWNEKMIAYKWIKDNVSPDAVLASLNNYQVNLYTGRQTIRVLDNINDVLKADYGVLIPYGSVITPGKDLSLSYFLPVLKKYPNRFELVYKTTDIQIYKVK
ncbi:MAG: hypothetical protein QMD71_05220 [bacterium]|nr:hypothetical protein [bacterium]